MVKNIAPPKNTGGGGYLFEDKVSAWYISHLLMNESPFTSEFGPIDRIDFQTRPDGWLFDDLLITVSTLSQEFRFALSIKSNVQFTKSKAPDDLVRAAWEQILHIKVDQFNKETDFLVFVTAPLPPNIKNPLNLIVKKAKDGDPKLLPDRYKQKGWASKVERSLFGSFHCPKNIALINKITEEDTGRLLQNLIFIDFDFDLITSNSFNDAIQRCRRVLKSGDEIEATKLWNNILQISSEISVNAGFINKIKLFDMLRGKFEFIDAPEYSSDWKLLQKISKTNIDLIGVST